MLHARIHFDIEYHDGSRSEAQTMAVKSSFLALQDEATNIVIPDWMAAYFAWHHDMKKKLSYDNWNSTKFLVMTCTTSDDNDGCGGLSDRLKPLPFMVLLANRTSRLLLIRWTRPCALEEFLIPPPLSPYTLDWIVPGWLAPLIDSDGRPTAHTMEQMLQFTQNERQAVVRAKFQSHNHGANFYNEETTDATTFEEAYHDLWHRVFRPSPEVSKLIDKTMAERNLVPGEYSAAHFRALYNRKNRDLNVTRVVSINAVNCASQMRPGGPVYFASDSKEAVTFIQQYAQQMSLPVHCLSHATPPLHLDKDPNWRNRTPSEFYSVFVDLYLIGQSRCLTYSIGGFGHFGLLMGFNASCGSRHFLGEILQHCPMWIDR